MTLADHRALAGIDVIVTRPAHLAEPFCARVEAHGGAPVRLPALQIDALPPPPSPGACDIAIFLSPNAVAFSSDLTLPRQALVMAVGDKTAAGLRQRGIPQIETPGEDSTSEGLLRTPALTHVAGKRILLVCGEGGRTLLQEELTARGATVERAEVYRRTIPALSRQHRQRALARPDRCVLTLTSGDAARNLVEMMDSLAQRTLFRLPLVAGSRRIARIANDLGFQQPAEIADNPGDEAMMTALLNLAARMTQRHE